MSPTDGKILWTCTFTLKYTGTEDKDCGLSDEMHLQYGDYTLDNYLLFMRGSETGKWQDYASTWETFEPLDPNTYECRALFSVSSAVAEDPNEPLYLNIDLLGESISYQVR